MLGNDKSAKEYLEEKYSTALSRREEKLKLTITPAEMREKKKTEEIFKDAGILLSLNILDPGIENEYKELDRRLEEKKSEIEKLYGTAVSEESIDIIKEVSDALKAECEQALEENERKYIEERDRIREESRAAIDDLSSSTEEAISVIEKEITALKSDFERDYERERVEYEYTLQRERKKEQEKRDSDVRSRKEALSVKEAEIKEQRNTARKRLDEIEEMQSNVDDIPALLEKAHKEGSKEMEESLNRANACKAEIEKKEQDNRIQALKDEYNRILKKYTELSDETMELSNRLDQCNAESRRLTGDTVRYIGGINILNSDARQHSEASAKK